MLFRKLLPLVAAGAALCPSLAHAQIGVFGTITGERIGGIACTSTTGNNVGSCSPGSTVTDKPYGSNFGGFYDFRTLGPVRFGAVIRGGVLNTNKDPAANISSSNIIREYSVMGGIHGSTGTPIKFLRPFGEIDAGWAKFGPVYAYNTYTKLQGTLGVDIPIASFLDIRAIELSAGALIGSGTHGTQSIGAGLVFHTPR